MAEAANDSIAQLPISCWRITHETMAASAFGEVAEEVSSPLKKAVSHYTRTTRCFADAQHDKSQSVVIHKSEGVVILSEAKNLLFNGLLLIIA